MSPLKKKKSTGYSGRETSAKTAALAHKVAPPLTDGAMFLKPVKFSNTGKTSDVHVRVFGAVGNSEWSRSQRAAMPTLDK